MLDAQKLLSEFRLAMDVVEKLRREYGLMVLATFIWGSGHPIGKLILRELTPLQLSFMSSAFGATSLIIWLGLTRKTRKLFEIRGRGLAFTLLSGAIIFYLYPNLSFSALQLIPASTNSILVASSTIFVAILASVILKEKLELLGYLGIVVSFVGIALVTLTTESQRLSITGIGAIGPIIALFAAVASALYALIGRKLRKYDAICVTMLGASFGSVLQAAMLLGSFGFAKLLQASGTTYALVAYWGVLSGLAYVAYYYCLGRIEAARASAFIYLSPLFATVLSVEILSEHLTAAFLCGLALTLAGIWLTQTSHGKK